MPRDRYRISRISGGDPSGSRGQEDDELQSTRAATPSSSVGRSSISTSLADGWDTGEPSGATLPGQLSQDAQAHYSRRPRSLSVLGSPEQPSLGRGARGIAGRRLTDGLRPSVTRRTRASSRGVDPNDVRTWRARRSWEPGGGSRYNGGEGSSGTRLSGPPPRLSLDTISEAVFDLSQGSLDLTPISSSSDASSEIGTPRDSGSVTTTDAPAATQTSSAERPASASTASARTAAPLPGVPWATLRPGPWLAAWRNIPATCSDDNFGCPISLGPIDALAVSGCAAGHGVDLTTMRDWDAAASAGAVDPANAPLCACPVCRTSEAGFWEDPAFVPLLRGLRELPAQLDEQIRAQGGPPREPTAAEVLAGVLALLDAYTERLTAHIQTVLEESLAQTAAIYARYEVIAAQAAPGLDRWGMLLYAANQAKAAGRARAALDCLAGMHMPARKLVEDVLAPLLDDADPPRRPTSASPAADAQVAQTPQWTTRLEVLQHVDRAFERERLAEPWALLRRVGEAVPDVVPPDLELMDTGETRGIAAVAMRGAAQRGLTDMVDELLDQGIAVDPNDPNIPSALALAVQGGHLATVELLLERGAHARRPLPVPTEPSEDERSEGEPRNAPPEWRTLTSEAIRRRDPAILERLLAAGAMVWNNTTHTTITEDVVQQHFEAAVGAGESPPDATTQALLEIAMAGCIAYDRRHEDDGPDLEASASLEAARPDARGRAQAFVALGEHSWLGAWLAAGEDAATFDAWREAGVIDVTLARAIVSSSSEEEDVAERLSTLLRVVSEVRSERQSKWLANRILLELWTTYGRPPPKAVLAILTPWGATASRAVISGIPDVDAAALRGLASCGILERVADDLEPVQHRVVTTYQALTSGQAETPSPQRTARLVALEGLQNALLEQGASPADLLQKLAAVGATQQLVRIHDRLMAADPHADLWPPLAEPADTGDTALSRAIIRGNTETAHAIFGKLRERSAGSAVSRAIPLILTIYVDFQRQSKMRGRVPPFTPSPEALAQLHAWDATERPEGFERRSLDAIWAEICEALPAMVELWRNPGALPHARPGSEAHWQTYGRLMTRIFVANWPSGVVARPAPETLQQAFALAEEDLAAVAAQPWADTESHHVVMLLETLLGIVYTTQSAPQTCLPRLRESLVTQIRHVSRVPPRRTHEETERAQELRHLAELLLVTVEHSEAWEPGELGRMFEAIADLIRVRRQHADLAPLLETLAAIQQRAPAEIPAQRAAQLIQRLFNDPTGLLPRRDGTRRPTLAPELIQPALRLLWNLHDWDHKESASVWAKGKDRQTYLQTHGLRLLERVGPAMEGQIVRFLRSIATSPEPDPGARLDPRAPLAADPVGPASAYALGMLARVSSALASGLDPTDNLPQLTLTAARAVTLLWGTFCVADSPEGSEDLGGMGHVLGQRQRKGGHLTLVARADDFLPALRLALELEEDYEAIPRAVLGLYELWTRGADNSLALAQAIRGSNLRPRFASHLASSLVFWPTDRGYRGTLIRRLSYMSDAASRDDSAIPTNADALRAVLGVITDDGYRETTRREAKRLLQRSDLDGAVLTSELLHANHGIRAQAAKALAASRTTLGRRRFASDTLLQATTVAVNATDPREDNETVPAILSIWAWLAQRHPSWRGSRSRRRTQLAAAGVHDALVTVIQNPDTAADTRRRAQVLADTLEVPIPGLGSPEPGPRLGPEPSR